VGGVEHLALAQEVVKVQTVDVDAGQLLVDRVVQFAAPDEQVVHVDAHGFSAVGVRPFYVEIREAVQSIGGLNQDKELLNSIKLKDYYFLITFFVFLLM